MSAHEHKKYEVILFDFDNTLVDLEGYWDRYIKEFAVKHYLEISNYKDFKYKIINEAEENFGLILADEFKKQNRIRQPIEIEFFPNILDTLNTLKDGGYILGIVTNAGKGRITAILSAKKMLDFFDVIVCADDVANVKPNPEPVLKALQAVSKTPEAALLVGDSYAEVWAGKSADVDTALLINQMQEPPLVNGTPINDKPTYTLESFRDLLKII